MKLLVDNVGEQLFFKSYLTFWNWVLRISILSFSLITTLCFTSNYDRGMTVLHDELHWLDVHERIEYKLGVMVYRCLHDWAPRYLADHLIPASDAAPRRLHLYDPLTWIVSLFLAADLARTAVGLFITLDRQSGTRYQMNVEILTVL